MPGPAQHGFVVSRSRAHCFGLDAGKEMPEYGSGWFRARLQYDKPNRDVGRFVGQSHCSATSFPIITCSRCTTMRPLRTRARDSNAEDSAGMWCR